VFWCTTIVSPFLVFWCFWFGCVCFSGFFGFLAFRASFYPSDYQHIPPTKIRTGFSYLPLAALFIPLVAVGFRSSSRFDPAVWNPTVRLAWSFCYAFSATAHICGGRFAHCPPFLVEPFCSLFFFSLPGAWVIFSFWDSYFYP